MQLRRGDVVTLTDSGGFAAKAFRLLGHKPLGIGLWSEALVEYASEVYSDEIVSGPGPIDTELPQPQAPVDVTALALNEEIYQVQTGLFASRLRATWTEPAFPFTQFYELTLRQGGQIVATAAVSRGTTEWVSGALVENLSYVVEVKTVSTVGAKSGGALASKTNDGKLAKPTAPTNLTGYEVGGEVRLEWTPGADLDLTAHEIRYSTTGGTWEAATLIDRIAAPARRMTTKVVPAGTWRFWCKALDSVRSSAYPNGQESVGSAYVDIAVTSDANAFVASSAFFVAPTLYKMSAYVDDAGPYYITDHGQSWDSLFPSTMSGYANPLWTYHTAAKSGLATEIHDVGTSVTGDWVAEIGYTLLDGAAALAMDLNNGGPEAAKTITGATNATPIVITATAHGYETGNEIEIAGVGGNTAANGQRRVTVIDANSFSLQDLAGNNVAGNGTYTSGGTAKRWVWISYPSLTAKTTARFVRLRIETPTGTLYVRKPGEFRCAVVSRREGGTATLAGAGSQPTTVLFASRYNAAVSAIASAIGSAGHYAMVDKIEVSGARGVQTGRVLRSIGGSGASANYASVADAAAFTRGNGTTDQAATWEFWMRVDALTGATQTIWAKGSGVPDGEWLIRISATGKLRFALIDQSAGAQIALDTAANIQPKVWTHVACVYDGTRTIAGMGIYLDGVLQSTFSASIGLYTAMEDTTVPVVFLNQYNGATYNSPFAGCIDEARMWDHARTPTQITDNMFAELTSGSGLIARYGFNETSGTTAADSIASRNATLVAAATLGVSFRPYDGMDLYRFDAAGSQQAGDVSWNFAGV